MLASMVSEVIPSKNVPRNLPNQIFTIEVLERNPTRFHGLVTSVAAGNNVVVVGTDRGWLIRHDFSGADTLGKFKEILNIS